MLSRAAVLMSSSMCCAVPPARRFFVPPDKLLPLLHGVRQFHELGPLRDQDLPEQGASAAAAQGVPPTDQATQCLEAVRGCPEHDVEALALGQGEEDDVELRVLLHEIGNGFVALDPELRLQVLHGE